MRYLGIEPDVPRVAVFDFTGCEGCELQLANKEETLVEFLNAIEIAAFRVVSSAASDDYEIAFIDDAITHENEVERLKKIRKRAKLLVAMGSCACFGGVNKLKNALDLDAANRHVYGDIPKSTLPTRPVKEVVPVDLEIPGCPVSKREVERILRHLIWGAEYRSPAYPVCIECKQHFTVCIFEGRGDLCLGPVTRGGCDAPCPGGGAGCWGCRGPTEDANYEEFLAIARRRGFSDDEIRERIEFFGGFEVEI
jgi:coenzyme F420-reducing hydrogenase gamma subunit